jgi:hypothetical protein
MTNIAGLEWFTDLPAALAEARRARKPVLSLRLLGRLDEQLSCANSRFFRAMLYPEPRINALLRDAFVLHWQSVRPVPIVTIDFGDGRRIVKTLTGNSVHVVLDAAGRPVDALPGLFDPATFLTLLGRARELAGAPRAQLALLHERALRQPLPSTSPRRAMAASMLAPTKHAVEMPMLRAVSPISVAADTRENLELHARVHELFAAGVQWNADELVSWIYRELFLMPPEDPALGLDIADPYAALPAQ